jgi:predicted acyl esterase
LMWDTAHRFLPGHRVGLEVASSAQPKFAVNLGTGGDEAEAREGVIAHNALHHSATHPSRLIVTVMPSA